MDEIPLDATFPFGRRVLPRRPSAKSRRRVFILGAHPSALHIAWWSPHRKAIKALPVDNEPVSFWSGADEGEQIETWKKAVEFRLGEWGEVTTSEEANGKAGRWLDEQVLGPLGATRDEACLSYCVDTCLVDGAAAFAVDERYRPFALEARLPEAHLRRRPRDGAFVELAVTSHRARLLHELSVVVPEVVVTLGNPALRVLRAITEAKRGLARLHADARYGVPEPLSIGRRSVSWVALTHHEAPGVFREAHERWKGSHAKGEAAP